MTHPFAHPFTLVSLGLMLALGPWALTACDNNHDASPDGGTSPDSQTPPELHAITPGELDAALADKDFLLINVHIPYEGEVPGTDTHIPYTDIDGLVDYIGPDLTTPVVIYCKSDYMTDIAGPELVTLGYRAITYLSGGMNAWVAAGFTLDP